LLHRNIDTILRMADLNTTIDRASQISRNVASLLDKRLRAAGERYRSRLTRATAGYIARGGEAAAPAGDLAGHGALRRRFRAALAPVLGRAA